MYKNKFPHYMQPDSKDCGPTCLRIIAKYYGKIISLQKLRDVSQTTRVGSNLMKLSDAAEMIGFKSIGAKINYNTLKEIDLPCIIHWNKNHFVVVYKIKKEEVYISDPAYGLINYPESEFIKHWIGDNATKATRDGIVLLLETTPAFKEVSWDKDSNELSIGYLIRYFLKYKALLSQLVIGLMVGSVLQLMFPFLTQSIVDIGIQNQDINFIYVILLAQIMFFMGKTSVDVIRSWILLHLSTRINISLISDFFIKLMKLPISYFDTRMTGDIMQRILDHDRIEHLLTGSTLNTLFSMFNLIVFGIVLIYYDLTIFLIFLVGSILYIIWILFFLRKRKEIDYKRFFQSSQEQSSVIELINGMQEIKLHNAEKQNRWKWEFIKIKLFKVSVQGLALEQTQGVGASFINEIKNILITFISAFLVIKGEITLGMMLSIQYIIGQLNSPIAQLVGFVQDVQDAKISLERLGEIHNKKDEENIDGQLISSIPKGNDIILNKVSYSYPGRDEKVIKKLNLKIPNQKITAIVGASGSGKSTLVKLILKFYFPSNGNLMLGEYNMNTLSHKAWREKCGVVMQEGFIFNDTIAYNISVSGTVFDKVKLIEAAKTANIYEFIESLPLGFNTKIGNEGLGISTGQKQRLLISRAVYKDPEFLFFDEATSALDAKNESIIMENLNNFFRGKTVIIIAHRLSTVKNADQIVVLEKGKIKEIGDHVNLVAKRGRYYDLVKNQLELEKLS